MENSNIPDAPESEYFSAQWSATPQTASGSLDLSYTMSTDKYQLESKEEVDCAITSIAPSQTSGSWQMSPASAQTITTSGHIQDDDRHLTGGDGSAKRAIHYEVTKISTTSLSGQEGPHTSQTEANAAAEAAKNTASNQLKNEAQNMANNAAPSSSTASPLRKSLSSPKATPPL